MKRSKYGNKKCEYLGIKFDSMGERDRYIFLKECESTGIIKDLRLQVPFKLYVNGVLICSYVADFVYWKDGCEIVDDFKGLQTSTFRLKKKLMLAIHGIDVKVVKTPTEEI